MPILDKLEPKSVFNFFEQICAIPHGTGNTKAISDWIVSFAEKRFLEVHQDDLNNVIIVKKATPGYEKSQPVILQGHMDMVCQQAPSCSKDMDNEGLDLLVKGDNVYAQGTTLGADDGIAVAMMLALLDADNISHPRIEAVFTMDEEVGMIGAVGIDVSPLQSKRLINLDSEEEGIFTVSCAGGNRSCCYLPITRAPFTGDALDITVNGLLGGHSGSNINDGRGNSNVLIGRVLGNVARCSDIRIVAVNGGQKDNAIPSCSTVSILTKSANEIKNVCKEIEAKFKKEFDSSDPDVCVTVTESEKRNTVAMDWLSTCRVICMLLSLPNGVQKMSGDVPNLVQTSLNLGILSTEEDMVKSVFCVRSSVNKERAALVDKLHDIMAQLGGHVETFNDYQAWEYQKDSPLRELLSKVFEEQYSKPPIIKAVHAGLECGMFAGKIPGLDCISVGPDIKSAHSFHETLSVSSVNRTWKFLLEVLRNLK